MGDVNDTITRCSTDYYAHTYREVVMRGGHMKLGEVMKTPLRFVKVELEDEITEELKLNSTVIFRERLDTQSSKDCYLVSLDIDMLSRFVGMKMSVSEYWLMASTKYLNDTNGDFKIIRFTADAVTAVFYKAD